MNMITKQIYLTQCNDKQAFTRWCLWARHYENMYRHENPDATLLETCEHICGLLSYRMKEMFIERMPQDLPTEYYEVMASAIIEADWRAITRLMLPDVMDANHKE